jgi:NADH:ubiquinone oxidoreductase subunit 6 (subunit J)
MLQKGFLKPDQDLENVRTIKRSRVFLIVGVVMIISALICMMFFLQSDESFTSQRSSVRLAGIAMIAGIVLALVGWWMNFFVQNKKYKKGV